MIKSRFVVMKHEAKRAGLHYDLRFRMPKSKEWDSYAVPKGVPIQPGKKVLAIKTTIHSEKEALLTGVIDDGYGAGKLTKWDEGECELIKYPGHHIAINFKGKKIKGIYHFINVGIKDRKSDDKQYWLFKGKLVNETTGMISRIPSCGINSDVEEGPTEEEGEKLHWSEMVDNYLKKI